MSEKFPGNNLRVNSLLPLCFWFILRWWHHPFSPSISLNSSFSLLLAFCLFFFNHHRTKQAQSPSRKLERVMSKCLRQPKKKSSRAPSISHPWLKPLKSTQSETQACRDGNSLFQGSCSSGSVCTHFCVWFLQHRTVLTAAFVPGLFREAAAAQLPVSRGFKEN